jgi:hypothetical protein
MRYSLIAMSVVLLAVVAAPFAHATDIEQACRTVPSEMTASLAPYPASADLERADPGLEVPSQSSIPESTIPALVPPRTREMQQASLFCYLACLFCSESGMECSWCAECAANMVDASSVGATAVACR